MSDSYPFDESVKVQINEIGLIIYKIIASSKKN